MATEHPTPAQAYVSVCANAELLHLLAQQIAKDLLPYEFGVIPELPSSVWLRTKLHEVLNDYVQTRPDSLSAMLYRMDISEAKIKSAMQSATPDERLNTLMQLVLEREAMKIWIRVHFKP